MESDWLAAILVSHQVRDRTNHEIVGEARLLPDDRSLELVYELITSHRMTVAAKISDQSVPEVGVVPALTFAARGTCFNCNRMTSKFSEKCLRKYMILMIG